MGLPIEVFFLIFSVRLSLSEATDSAKKCMEIFHLRATNVELKKQTNLFVDLTFARQKGKSF